MGGGCAYLYRGDVLYPLTPTTIHEAIDGNGKSVQESISTVPAWPALSGTPILPSFNLTIA